MRLFIALELDQVVRRALADVQDMLRDTSARVSWTPVEQMHLTVKFLGESPDHQVPQVCEALQAIAANVEPFECVLQHFGCFPPRGKARVLWAGMECPPALAVLNEACEQTYADMGFKREQRRYHPHMTIARIKTDPGNELRDRIADLSAPAVPVQYVEQVTLFQSTLRREGAVHTALCRASLNGSTTAGR